VIEGELQMAMKSTKLSLRFKACPRQHKTQSKFLINFMFFGKRHLLCRARRLRYKIMLQQIC